VGDEEMALEKIKAQLKRKASRMVLGGFRPPEEPEASWFGRILLAKPDEDWPVYEGKPMLPLCQLNLGEAPYIPLNLADISLITIFISAATLPLDTPNGIGWELRTYSPLEHLVKIAAPTDENEIRPFPIRWELIEEDYPTWEDVAIELPETIEENYYDLFETQACSKIGGWPSLIQSELYWAPFNQHPANPEYVFQINSEEKAQWMWGDQGTGYFGRGAGQTKDTWTLTWQCF
jgi:uncharacterized protein YwqG